jgi:VanZ family protein
MLNYRRVWVSIAWLLLILIIYLSLTPQPPEPVKFDNADKYEHAFAYATVSFWLCLIYRNTGARVLIIAGLILLGVFLEYAQGWTGYRTFDVQDMLADGVGVLAGWLLVLTPLGRLLIYIDNKFVKLELK